MTEQKLKELLADMTLEEKVNQMSQVVGAFFNKDMDITAMGPMADKGFTPENVALSGSILGSMGAETLKKIQKDFVEQHPHHIPMLFMLDVINANNELSSAAQGLADSVNNAANAQINNANTQIANANAQIDSARAVLQQQLDAANAAGNTELAASLQTAINSLGNVSGVEAEYKRAGTGH